MDLDRFTPALITFVANRLSSSGSATYRSRFNIGIMDFRVLAMLSVESGICGARIAEVVGLDKAAVSRTLRSLKRRGLVSIVPGVGRNRMAALTPKGEDLFRRAHDMARQRERLLLSTFSADERETLVDFLHRLLAAAPALKQFIVEKAVPDAIGPRQGRSRGASKTSRKSRAA